MNSGSIPERDSDSEGRRDFPPAVVVSGHTMALGVVRSLGRMGVPVAVVHYDPRDTAQFSRHAVAQFPSPHPEHRTAEFLQVLRQCARSFPGAVLIPASDDSLVTVARHKEILSRDFIVAAPDWPTVRACIEKKETALLAEKWGVPAPRTVVPASSAEVENYARNVPFPCLVKPSQSHLFYERFGRKMFKADNLSQMLDVYHKAAEAGLEVMLQEIIPGGDNEVVNYNAYAVNGVVRTEFTAVHIRNAPPIFGSPRVALSQEIPDVIPHGRRMLEALSYTGYACTEFKRDLRDGTFKLMEVNARHNLSTLLAVQCGINFPWLEYRHRVFGEIPSALPFRSGVYWVDILRDVGYSLKHLRQERYSPVSYLRPYLASHVFAIFDKGDLRPFLRRCAYLAGQGVRATLKAGLPKKKYDPPEEETPAPAPPRSPT